MPTEEKKDTELSGFEQFLCLLAVVVVLLLGFFILSLFNNGPHETNYGGCETRANPTPCDDMPDPNDDKWIEDVSKDHPDDSY
jgi:hypothetical protein